MKDVKKEKFIIKEVYNTEYKVMVIVLDSVFLTEILDEIERELEYLKVKGNVLIDTLLFNGNNDERFISIYFDGQKFDLGSYKIVKFKKDSSFRRITSDYLRVNKEILEYSILNDFQRKLIKKGIDI
ncbi:hypothetical protein Calkro_0662 [Caldicellulosiruptor kronotskyensis 2002]|uniref:Uncharacterized protein n=1 Tax=Caldicellulosiruptor kronotskyensis (strain DSM 18902 / VKM B-2412 / 2002) TaxID=632348 RepID=E4SER8_CALK2|nr:type II toxin-antitoxin system RnlB family antitoxin [Caldicellulosiruptor kronotskyensis]ADQ45555.1 hypothetical protein Calkro_0662 [Caldicellulosiruptor kronotskyensis 2002]